jgi:hypothetical protein
MDDVEAKQMRREILGEVGTLLKEELAGGEWGRALVEVVRGDDGEPVVAGVDVEDIFGDESRIDAAFAPEVIGPFLPMLAKATEALCGLAGVELDDVNGGTFLLQVRDGTPPASDFEWLPGLVHAPSPSFERARGEALSRLRAKRAGLDERFGLERMERYDVDIEHESIGFSSGGQARVRARATLIGTYARASCAWGWGGYSKNVPERARAASAALVDGILERDMWELGTPVFAMDEHTAWALAAIVCERVEGEGVYCSRTEEGLVFLLLRDVQAVA